MHVVETNNYLLHIEKADLRNLSISFFKTGNVVLEIA